MWQHLGKPMKMESKIERWRHTPSMVMALGFPMRIKMGWNPFLGFTLFTRVFTAHWEIQNRKQGPLYLSCKKWFFFVRLQIFLHAGCNILHPEQLATPCKRWWVWLLLFQIWSGFLHNWHFLAFFVHTKGSCLMRLLVLEKIRIGQIGQK